MAHMNRLLLSTVISEIYSLSLSLSPQAQGPLGGGEEGQLEVLPEEDSDWRGGGFLWFPPDQQGPAALPQEGLQYNAVP